MDINIQRIKAKRLNKTESVNRLQAMQSPDRAMPVVASAPRRAIQTPRHQILPRNAALEGWTPSLR